MSFIDPIPGNPPPGATPEEEPILAELKTLAAWDSFPCLSEAELLTNLRGAIRWRPWVAEAEVAFGARHAATPFNGRLYKCVQAGVTGTVQPAFLPGTNIGRRYSDGTAIWEDAGPVSAERYDLRAAVCRCWQEKASATAHEHSFSPGGNQKFDRAAIHEHCVAQARRWKPVRVG